MTETQQELDKYGLTSATYEACLADIENKTNGSNDMDWDEIVEKYNLNIHRDTLRKASRTIFGGSFVLKYFNEKNAGSSNDARLLQLRLEKEALKKERQKLRDEKLEYNRWLREEARDELICEKIQESIASLTSIEFPHTVFEPIVNYAEDKEAILCFADTHYGTEFEIKGLYGEILNKYNPEIFEERMENLLAETIATIKEKKLKRIRVFSLGDEIDGILRVSQLMKLRYGVVESTTRYANYISYWLNELTKYAFVDFYAVKGNHCELRMLSQPKGTFTNENMTFVINDIIKGRLCGNSNFIFHENPSGLIFDKICGYNVLGIHGEVKNMETAIQSFSNVYNTMIDILVGGHKHHLSEKNVGINRDVVNVPSVIGIDDYSLSLGKIANPGATIIILKQNKGIAEQINLKF